MFQPIKLIGQGTFGQVFLVRKVYGVDRGIFYALKTIRKSKLRGKALEHTWGEHRILEMVRNSPFVVKLHYAFQDSDSFFFGMEFVEGGTLYDLMKAKYLTEFEVQFYAAELVAAIESLHTMDVVHRDIKPDNIFIGRDGHIKIGDFGVSIRMDSRRTYSYCGTLYYMSPEVVRKCGHGKEVDWWALGVIIYEMLMGSGPCSETTKFGL